MYNFALDAHKNKKGRVPYINHPVAVADILSDLKQIVPHNNRSLHDTIEDTHATYQTIKEEFGQEVADLVEGVTKISVF